MPPSHPPRSSGRSRPVPPGRSADPHAQRPSPRCQPCFDAQVTAMCDTAMSPAPRTRPAGVGRSPIGRAAAHVLGFHGPVGAGGISGLAPGRPSGRWGDVGPRPRATVCQGMEGGGGLNAEPRPGCSCAPLRGAMTGTRWHEVICIQVLRGQVRRRHAVSQRRKREDLNGARNKSRPKVPLPAGISKPLFGGTRAYQWHGGWGEHPVRDTPPRGSDPSPTQVV